MFGEYFIIGFGISFGWFLARAIVKRIDYIWEAFEKAIGKKILKLTYKLEEATSRLTGKSINEIRKSTGRKNDERVIVKGFRAE